VPPNEGSTNLANIVSTINNRAALIKIVAENRSIMKAPLELAVPWPEAPFLGVLIPSADIKLRLLPS
jgi:hypothetical protein